MQISICSYTFHQQTRAGVMNAFGYLEAVKYRYGLSAADFWHGTFESLDEDYLAKLKDGLAERELALSNVCIDRAHIWADEPEVRESNAHNAEANLKAAEYLGAQTVRIDAGGTRDERTWNDQQFEAIVNQYRLWAQRAHDNGYRIGPENHWGAAMAPANIKKLCEAVDHPGFGILLHAGRWHDQPAEGDELVAPWAMHTHFSPALNDEALLRTMNALREAGYQGCYSVELVANRYSEAGVMTTRLADVGERWRQAAK
jgi:sugar phosphate isomerase/epimerase